jgi:AraC-like DNA-binding protein
VYDFSRSGRSTEAPFIVGPYHFVTPDFEVHRHTYGELVAVLAGRGRHLAGSADYELREGDVFFIPPGLPHGFRNASGMEIQNLAFEPERTLADALPSLRRLPGYHALFHLEPAFRTREGIKNRLRLTPGHLHSVRPLLDRLAREYALALPGHGAMLHALVLELVTHLCRIFSAQHHVAYSSVQRLARVASLIETDFASPLRLEDLAEAAHLSRNHLIRLFTETYGLTPMRRLLHVRLEHARDLLANTDLPVAAVGEACGFRDANYFARVFRRYEGSTPSAYREGTSP